MRFVCISDTHTKHALLDPLPGGDILIHTGDFCGYGSGRELERFADWLGRQPHAHKIVIAGNHDRILLQQPETRHVLEQVGATYLLDSGYELDGIRFWGSPWTPEFGHGWFMKTERELAPVWARIDNQPHVLLTHDPANGRLDRTSEGLFASSTTLAAWLAEHPVPLHVHGHIQGYGRLDVDGYTLVNAAICDARYRVVHPPQVVDVDLHGDQLSHHRAALASRMGSRAGGCSLMGLSIWRKHVWKKVARELRKRDGVPFDLALTVVRANRRWLTEAWDQHGAYKLWDKLTDYEAENCPEQHWPYWFEDGTPDIAVQVWGQLKSLFVRV